MGAGRRSSCGTGGTSGCSDGFGTDFWSKFGELGLSAVAIPESHGGLGLGATEAALILEEIGRNLTPSPFLMTSVVAARAIEGTAQADAWYPRVVSGEAVLTLAVDEGPRHDPDAIALPAEAQGNGFVLNGAKQFVIQGASADMIVTAARTDNGITLFAVPKGAAETENVALVDGRRPRAALRQCRARRRRGDRRGRWRAAPLNRALDAGRAGAAAELVGVAAGISAMTVDYLTQRKQFGRAIGEFQALQHRAAHLYGEIEIARAAALKAAQLLDSGDDSAPLYVSVAKAKAADVAASPPARASRCTAASA